MKNISISMKNHLAQVVTTIATCWRIERLDGAVFAFTTFDADLVVSGVTYKSAVGFSRTAIVTHTGGQVDNLETLGFFDDSGITEHDLRNGRFDYASIYLFAVNWADITMGIIRLRRGWLGECIRTPSGAFQAELRGINQALVQEFGNVFQPLCRADLGDAQCTVPIIGTALQQFGTVIGTVNQRQFATTPLAYSARQLNNKASITFVENVTAGSAIEISDGVGTLTVNVIFDTLGTTVRDMVVTNIGLSGLALTTSVVGTRIDITNHSGQQGVISKTGDLANGIFITNFSDNYLDGGVVTWTGGQNTGISMEMKTYLPAGQNILLWLSMKYPIAIGDTFWYYPGCNKRRDTCLNKFNNVLNFRAEPDMPGVDKMLSYPDAA